MEFPNHESAKCLNPFVLRGDSSCSYSMIAAEEHARMTACEYANIHRHPRAVQKTRVQLFAQIKNARRCVVQASLCVQKQSMNPKARAEMNHRFMIGIKLFKIYGSSVASMTLGCPPSAVISRACSDRILRLGSLCQHLFKIFCPLSTQGFSLCCLLWSSGGRRWLLPFHLSSHREGFLCCPSSFYVRCYLLPFDVISMLSTSLRT